MASLHHFCFLQLKRTPLFDAITAGNIDVVKALLTRADIDLNIQDKVNDDVNYIMPLFFF